jgi:hypothetical protein
MLKYKQYKNMKTKMKRQGSTELPRFAVGAIAIAATTASSQASTVQITLTGNKISTTGGNQLVADLTGDLSADVSFISPTVAAGFVSVAINGNYVMAMDGGAGTYFVDAMFAFGGVGVDSGGGSTPQAASFLNPITFTDQRINGGAPTGGWLQVNAYNTSATSHTVEFARLIFDDKNTTRPAFASIPGTQTEWSAVPEPSSFLLLTLGAGGLIARRRRQAA